MKFFAFASVALAAVANVVAAIDSATVVMNIKDLTDLSSQTNQMVAGINLVNFAAKAPVSIGSHGMFSQLLTCLHHSKSHRAFRRSSLSSALMSRSCW
jgi:hypothetical protein